MKKYFYLKFLILPFFICFFLFQFDAYSNDNEGTHLNGREKISSVKTYSFNFIIESKNQLKRFLIINKEERYLTSDGGLTWLKLGKEIQLDKFLFEKEDGSVILTEDRGLTWSIVNRENKITNPFIVSPNPSSSFFNISSDLVYDNILNVNVLDLYGNILIEQNGIKGKSCSLNIDYLHNGIYLVKVEYESGNSFTTKIIKN